MAGQMSSVPASAAPAELGGVKDTTELKGLAVGYFLTRLCPSARRQLLPWVKGSAFVQIGSVYLVITVNCVSRTFLAEGARRFSKAN